MQTPDDVFAYVETNTRLAIEKVFCGRKHKMPVETARTASHKVATTILAAAGKRKDSQTFFYTLNAMKEYFGPTEDTVTATRRILINVGMEGAANIAKTATR
jgi:hypothetical protein